MSHPRDIHDAPGPLPGEEPDTIGEELARRLTDLDIAIDTQHPEWDGEFIRARVAWSHFARLVRMSEYEIGLAIHPSGRIEATMVSKLGPVCLYTQATGGTDAPIVVGC